MYNPATGRREFIIISTEEEVAMGRNVHNQIVKDVEISDDSNQITRLLNIGAKLARVSDRQDYKYKFYLVSKKGLNAFTTPGGNIYFHSELMMRLKTDEEIAAVLAHEIGHCAARHTVKKFQAALGYNLISALALSHVDAGEGAKTTAVLAGNTVMQLAMSSYSRSDEYEADRLGIKYMYLAGYDLNGMIKTLQVLEKESKGPNAPFILRTHPFISDRIKAARDEVYLVKYKYDKTDR